MSVQCLNKTEAWVALESHANEMRGQKIIDLFHDKKRMTNMVIECDDILFDFSKQHASQKTIELLCALAEQENTSHWLNRMFDGDVVNVSENIAAHHTALRSPHAPEIISAAFVRMKKISENIRNDKNITDFVHIGIGGSDLGPRLVCDALKGMATGPRIHFVTNVSPDDLDNVLEGLNPENTWVSVASKSFTTQETMLNLKRVQVWLGNDFKNNIIAMTAAHQRARASDIIDEHILPMWPWVGGRFSVWSCVGLPIAVMLGFDGFQEFLNGAYGADQHVHQAQPQKNAAYMMALLSVWNRNFMKASASAILPYGHALKHLPYYAQQLEMESNGKSVDRDGAAIEYGTSPLIFGQTGTNGQHAVHQMLHQGTDIIPCDFIGITDQAGDAECNKVLMANMLAQAQALMLGRHDVDPAMRCPGNRPSTCMILPKLSPYHLGFLMAIFEHKTALQGFIWRINPFDQFGVELGKILAKDLLAPIDEVTQNKKLDDSTRKLIFHTFGTKWKD